MLTELKIEKCPLIIRCKTPRVCGINEAFGNAESLRLLHGLPYRYAAMIKSHIYDDSIRKICVSLDYNSFFFSYAAYTAFVSTAVRRFLFCQLLPCWLLCVFKSERQVWTTDTFSRTYITPTFLHITTPILFFLFAFSFIFQ